MDFDNQTQKNSQNMQTQGQQNTADESKNGIKIEPTKTVEKKYSYQPKEEYYEWNGQKFDLKTLPPEAIKEFYKTHSNIANWRKKLTQSQQEVAEQRKILESVQSQINAINSFFDEHPDLLDIIKAYKEAVDNGEDTKAYLLKKVFNQEMQKLPQNEQKSIAGVRMPFETQSEYEQRLKSIEAKLAEKEQLEAEEKAKKALKQKFPDLTEEEFDEYAKRFADKEVSLEDLFEIIEKARRYEKYMQEKNSNDASLLTNTYKPRQPQAVEQQENEMTSDSVFDSIWSKVFKK